MHLKKLLLYIMVYLTAIYECNTAIKDLSTDLHGEGLSFLEKTISEYQ